MYGWARTSSRPSRCRSPTFLSEIAVAGHLHAENRTLGFVIDPIDPGLAVKGDPQLSDRQ